MFKGARPEFTIYKLVSFSFLVSLSNEAWLSDLCDRTRKVATTRGSTRVERYFAPLPRSSGFPLGPFPWVFPLGPLGFSPTLALGMLTFPFLGWIGSASRCGAGRLVVA